MARFDVFLDVESDGLLLDVQADLLDKFRTRVVVPLLPPAQTPAAIKRLNPVFELDGRSLVMATHLLGVVPTASLTKPSGNLSRHHDEIVAALDMLFQGF